MPIIIEPKVELNGCNIFLNIAIVRIVRFVYYKSGNIQVFFHPQNRGNFCNVFK